MFITSLRVERRETRRRSVPPPCSPRPSSFRSVSPPSVRLTSFPRLSPVRSLPPGLPPYTREPATAVGSHLLPHGRGSTRPAALYGERRGPSPEETRRNRAGMAALSLRSSLPSPAVARTSPTADRKERERPFHASLHVGLGTGPVAVHRCAALSLVHPSLISFASAAPSATK